MQSKIKPFNEVSAERKTFRSDVFKICTQHWWRCSKPLGSFRCQGCVNARPWFGCFESQLISNLFSSRDIFSGEASIWAASNGAGCSVQYCSTWQLHCVLFGLCVCLSSGRPKRCALTKFRGPSGRSWWSWRWASQAESYLCKRAIVYWKSCYNMSMFIQVHTVQAVLKLVREVEGKKQVSLKWRTTTRNLDALNLLLEYF